MLALRSEPWMSRKQGRIHRSLRSCLHAHNKGRGGGLAPSPALHSCPRTALCSPCLFLSSAYNSMPCQKWVIVFFFFFGRGV